MKDTFELAREAGLTIVLTGKIGREEYNSVTGSLEALVRFAILHAAQARQQNATKDFDEWFKEETLEARMNGRDVSEWPAKNAFEAGRAFERNAIVTAPTKPAEGQGPIAMLLYCPKCGAQHIDAPEAHDPYRAADGSDDRVRWTNPPHRSHLCHACGTIWRPADIATTGVAAITTRGKADTWVAFATAPMKPAEGREKLCDRIVCARNGGCVGDDVARGRKCAALASAPTMSAEGDAIPLMQERPWHWRDTGPLDTGDQS